MSDIEQAVARLHLEVGCVTDGDGNPLADEAIIFFRDDDGSSEIKVSAENANLIANRIARLWNAPPPGGSGRADVSDETPFTKRELEFRDAAIHLQEQLGLMSIEHEIMRKALETIAGTAADKLQALQAKSALANIGASHQ